MRSASGSGGGPDKTIFAEASLIDPARVRLLCIYLRKPDDSLDGIRHRARDAGASLLEIPGRSLFDCTQFQALRHLLQRERVDVLHCHEPKGDLLGALMPLAASRVRIITTLHGWTAPRSRKSALFARLDRLCLRRFEQVLAVSRPLEHAARQAGARSVQYLPNGVDTLRWQPGQAATHPALAMLAPSWRWVGYVGRLSDEKAPERFVQMAARVVRAMPDAGFVLAGDGPCLDACRRLAGELGLGDHVVLTGRLEETAIRCLLDRLTLLVNPSRTEGLPNNVLEAMAMAVPVVATAVGGVPDLVQDGTTGVLIPPTQDDIPDALARAVLSLMRDPDLLRRMGQAGRARVEREFSFHARVETMTALYETLTRRA
ncbi:glycosyltransferase family 4 protein [Megalodesulfovibrio gigas]|uniref:glycosyltransferase family 4 protein n=1 Tax=Megalodesulfovibrio gigas TaxID=879 RepID=UPI000417AA35|nr:glycosyltransferase family 4 protein [Megalodesulfovibrio gigas]